MSESEPGGIRLRTRTLGRVYPDDDTTVTVEHVFEPEGAGTCEDCGNPSHDPGMVALVVHRHADEDGDEGEFASVLEREAAKFGGHGA